MLDEVRLIVKGEVQGVFYRAFAREVAESLSITGWARNTAEGTVEIVAQGTKKALETLVTRCRTGPASCSVQGVDVTWKSAEKLFEDFVVR